MKRILLSSLVSVLLSTTLLAESTEFDLSLKVGLSSLENDNGWNFEKTTIATDLTYDLGYVIKPRFDLTYVNVNEPKTAGDTSALVQLALDGLYEVDLSDRYYIDPYLFAGMGYEKVVGSRRGFENQFYLQGGVGAKYPVTDTLNFVTEFRGIQILDSSRSDEKNEFAFLLGVNIPFHTQEVALDLDDDKDGVLNAEDLCPKTPQGAVVDMNGCPVLTPDTKETAVTKVEVVQEPAVLKEVPVVCETPPKPKRRSMIKKPKDSDKDGVIDRLDECPNTPANFRVNKAGCGIQKRLEVHFASNTANLTPASMVKIKEFASYLKRYPKARVTIEGYTDSSGDEWKNKILSKKRAEAVKRVLVKYGISARRIVAVGKGSLNPIADNETKEGRAKNRRIEAIIHH